MIDWCALRSACLWFTNNAIEEQHGTEPWSRAGRGKEEVQAYTYRRSQTTRSWQQGRRPFAKCLSVSSSSAAAEAGAAAEARMPHADT